jgi:hypothetical protein
MKLFFNYTIYMHVVEKLVAHFGKVIMQMVIQWLMELGGQYIYDMEHWWYTLAR